MPLFEKLCTKLVLERVNLMADPFLERLWDEVQRVKRYEGANAATLRDHYLQLAQIGAIEKALAEKITQLKLDKTMSMDVQQLLFKHYFCKRDMEYIAPYLKDSSPASLLPATQSYIEKISNMNTLELLGHFAARAMFDICYNKEDRKVIQTLYDRVIPGYNSREPYNNHGVTCYCNTDSLHASFNGWLDSIKTHEGILTESARQALQTYGAIYRELEANRKQPRLQNAYCRLFTVGVVITAASCAALNYTMNNMKP